MADLYPELCSLLMRAESALNSADVAVRPVHLDLKQLQVDTNEQFFHDIKSHIEYFVAHFRSGPQGRREVFYGALYNALMMVTQTNDKELRKKMLIKIYAWLLSNQSRASLNDSPERPPFLTLPMTPLPRAVRHFNTIQTRHLDENRPIEASVSYAHTRRRVQSMLRPELVPFAKPRERKVDTSSSLTKKLMEYRREQLRTLRDLMESKRALRTMSRGKSRADRRVPSRPTKPVPAASPEAWSRLKVPSKRPPTVIKMTPGPLATPSPTLRSKSRLDGRKAESVMDIERPSVTSELSSYSPGESISFMSEISHIKLRLSQAKVPISYKTLADGLAPPKPAAKCELPEGGELLTSNPFLQLSKVRAKKVRNGSLPL